MGDGNKILYGHVEQLTTRDAPQPIGTTFGPTPQHERYPTNKFREGAAARAAKAARKYVSADGDGSALDDLGGEAAFEAGYLRGAEETVDLISAFVDNLCLEYPSVRSVKAIQDLQELLNGGR